jgi:hypothetical protein
MMVLANLAQCEQRDKATGFSRLVAEIYLSGKCFDAQEISSDDERDDFDADARRFDVEMRRQQSHHRSPPTPPPLPRPLPVTHTSMCRVIRY